MLLPEAVGNVLQYAITKIYHGTKGKDPTLLEECKESEVDHGPVAFERSSNLHFSMDW
jgi:hypothetical protein